MSICPVNLKVNVPALLHPKLEGALILAKELTVSMGGVLGEVASFLQDEAAKVSKQMAMVNLPLNVCLNCFFIVVIFEAKICPCKGENNPLNGGELFCAIVSVVLLLKFDRKQNDC